MAELSQLKRQREVESGGEEETCLEVKESFQDSKRQRTYNQILSILEEDEEEEFNQDNNFFSSDIFTTLQQELNQDSTTSPSSEEADPVDQQTSAANSSSSSSECSQRSNNDDAEDEDGRYDNVIRHLLEASDDELGLPSPDARTVAGGGGDSLPFPVNDGLWEFEDETANYYAMLQSELFM